MEKTKLGLPVCLAIAAVYLLVYFGGYTPALLVLGFVLLKEENQTLKISAITAVAVALAYSLINMLIGFIPNLLELVTSFIRVFDAYYYLDMPSAFINFLYNVLSVGRTVVFVALAVMAAMDKPILPGFIKKYLD